MDILLAALLAGKTVLPTIDRHTLELQARAEALQPRSTPATRTTQTTRTTGTARTTPAATTTRQPTVRRASASGTLDLGSITTICRAAGNQADPAGFIARLGRAYSLSAEENQSLRTSCAAYLTGRADARRASNGE